MYLQLNDRDSRSLNGTWGFLADNMGAFGLKRSRNIYEGLTPVEEDRAVEYDIEAFRKISVPGDWNTQRDEFLHFEGFGWYTRRVPMSAKQIAASARLFLRLDGVNYSVDVWWNGVKIGSEEMPFLPLSFELEPENLREENLLVIRVDARRLPHRIPGEKYDWFNYGGLIRSVRLLSVPAAFISQAACHSTTIIHEAAGDRASVSARYTVHCDAAAGYELQIQIDGLGINFRSPVTEGIVDVPLENLLVRLWEPGSPHLYTARLELLNDGRIVDRIEQQIGFRQIEVDGTQLLLNKKPLFLRGIAMHEERLGVHGGKPRNHEDIAEIIDLAEELNTNFLRLAHYPYDEQWLVECDRRGLLVWDEIPVYWDMTWTDDKTKSLIERCATRLAQVSRSHPCIFCHALANETWDAEGRMEALALGAAAFKCVDPSVPVTAAFNAPYRDGKYDLPAENDALYEAVEFAGLNEYGGWYSPPVSELKTANIGVGEKPLMVTEFGAEGPVDTRGESDKLWNLDSQLAIYEEQFRMFDRCPQLSGITPWVLKDFRSTLRANGFQNGWNCKGLVGAAGQKKPVFEFIRRNFARIAQDRKALTENSLPSAQKTEPASAAALG